MKEKVLFIISLPPPIHGANMVGQTIRQSALINDTFECDFINLSTSKKLSEISKGGFRKLISCLKLYLKVFTTVINKRYDLYYLTIYPKGNGFYKDFIVVIILKIFGGKVIYHYHQKGISEGENIWWLNLMYRFQFKNSDAILLSPLLYQDVAKYLPKERVHYLANGISQLSNTNLDVINSKRQQKLTPIILYLSNMMVEKGVLTLLESSKLLYGKGIKFKMNFVGDWFNITEAEFKRFVLQNNLHENVFYLGKKYGEDKYACFEDADIFGFPSYYDTFPLVTLEAMQFGLPIISTSEGGIPDIVSDTETGFLIKSQDAKELADKIEYLLENPDVRIKMGLAAKRRYEELFRTDIFENNLISILKSSINKINSY